MIEIIKIGDSPKVTWLNLECRDCGTIFKATDSEVKKGRSDYYGDRFEDLKSFYRDWKYVLDKFELKIGPHGGWLDYLWIDYEYVECPVCKNRVIINASLQSHVRY